MQAGGVGLIFVQSGDNRLDLCVLIPCNKVGHKFFLTSEKQVLRLQSSNFPRVLKGNGACDGAVTENCPGKQERKALLSLSDDLTRCHTEEDSKERGHVGFSAGVCQNEYFGLEMFKYRACDVAVTENCPDKHEQKQYFRLVMNERVFL
ncbi:hypothetical protein Q3G72_015679 [Acer saccharum]|nr:hypothetical protein Q3G72_015679 [Acer saccharum]